MNVWVFHKYETGQTELVIVAASRPNHVFTKVFPILNSFSQFCKHLYCNCYI